MYTRYLHFLCTGGRAAGRHRNFFFPDGEREPERGLGLAIVSLIVVWLSIASYLVHIHTRAQNDSSNSNASCSEDLRDYVYHARNTSIAFSSRCHLLP